MLVKGRNVDLFCPLCESDNSQEVPVAVSKRRFYRCNICDFLWVPAEHHISLEAERQRYLHHNNLPEDAGHRAFLSRLSSPMIAVLSSGARGLDFGSGPSPTLCSMFSDAGYRVDRYDPFFGPYEIKEGQYDFITSTEVVEHFRTPRKELDKIYTLLSQGGYLGVMTQEVPDDSLRREQWYYFRDTTHVSFFTDRSMQWWSSLVGLKTVYRSKGVWIFQKV